MKLHDPTALHSAQQGNHRSKQNASFAQLLDTSKYPETILTLTKPIVFSSIPSNGHTMLSQATVSLALHGSTHTVTLTVLARYTRSVLEATGSAPIAASDWGIKSPFGVHKDATIEFLIVLHRG
jgi:polyisoprenoid-binding protein YceI